MKTVTGKVVSNKMDKTIVVLVERKVKHPKYEKYVVRSSKMHAHNPENQCHMGDLVKIRETRPLSKQKTWELMEVLRASVELDGKTNSESAAE